MSLQFHSPDAVLIVEAGRGDEPFAVSFRVRDHDDLMSQGLALGSDETDLLARYLFRCVEIYLEREKSMGVQGSMDGPYDATNYGVDAYQHPVNQYGRCAKLNSNPPTCPPSAADRTTQLLAMPAAVVRGIGVYLGVPNAGTILIALLVPLIVAAEGLV